MRSDKYAKNYIEAKAHNIPRQLTLYLERQMPNATKDHTQKIIENPASSETLVASGITMQQ